MLTVYTYPIPKPANVFDVSGISLDELVDACLAILHHQKSAHIWFGYLDGWMLNPREEVLLRKVIRTFPCTVVSHFPLAFSQSWKNEIDTIYTSPLNGDPNTDNNGSTLHHGSSSGHEQVDSQPPVERNDHQDRKARRPQARRIKKGQNPTPNNDSSCS
jgi:hypothetical protein